MSAIQGLAFVLVGACGTAVALARDPRRQALLLSLYGMVLTALFLALQAPDVALSELAVGAAASPLMLLVALANVQAGPAGAEKPRP